ncbi:hypothetical protein L2E82_31480 [Cichorium intybus]|uniref:Uncharacterized protein n=1 Tax=Cichorium intybus TaxID=13427 RepID=A0ACB9BEI5_CICIN|nr:hypothetical protein L2E82_31480 [Cichorium intybus]
MEFGEAHRHIGETNMNLHSSRSHTIFRMIIESRDKAKDEYSEGSSDAIHVSILNLVDLADPGLRGAAAAGSFTTILGLSFVTAGRRDLFLLALPRVDDRPWQGGEGSRAPEGGERRREKKVFPYRDNKLTRILQPSLGGNANTAIICTISLAQTHADETKSSLQFASWALRVTNCVHVNEILSDAALLDPQKEEMEEPHANESHLLVVMRILMLEMGRSSRLQQLESDVELETEENIHASNKHEEDENTEVLTKLLADIQEIICNIQDLKTFVESTVDEHLQTCTVFSELIAMSNSKLMIFTVISWSFSSIDLVQIKTLLMEYEKLHSCMKPTIYELARQKVLLPKVSTGYTISLYENT